MNLFETVKPNVAVKQVAEHYGCKVNRGDMICRPIHDDLYPSMNLSRNNFYCFGCGVTGDVVDFVAQLFGLRSYEATKKLSYGFGINLDKPPAAAVLKKSHPLARAFRDDEMYCQWGRVIICICCNAGKLSMPRNCRRMIQTTTLWGSVR